MPKKTMLLLLIISFAFNLAFLGTYLVRRVDPTFGPFQPDHNRPKLTPGTHEKFMECRDELVERKHAYSEARRRFFLSLINSDLDDNQLKAKLDTLIAKQCIMEKEIGLSFIKLKKEMTTDEAKRFFLHDLRPNNMRSGHMRGRKR
ncbi:MAG: hypothetical protein K9N07_00340 [Candidatus Cloacimonetes bacterium]|nr:hypothetical protein [Candidatus Cloacimonadota bacterium]